MKNLFFLFFCFCFSLSANSQSTKDSVKNVVKTLFTAMKNADGPMLQTCFANNAILQTITDEQGSIKDETVQEFVHSISALAIGDADERIVFDVIKIDETLAIVWTPYQFFYKGIFSHCGVDSFQLVRINGLWKIQYLIDTRRKKSCS